MPTRKPLGPRARFDVFKRDNFTCCYCGKTPPGTTLEVDHVIPVSAGGSDTLGNLVTACVDCNRGKGARGLAVPVPAPDLQEQVTLIRARAEQVKRYNALLARERKKSQAQVDELHDYWLDRFPMTRWAVQVPFDQSFLKWLRFFTMEEIKSAIDTTARARGVSRKPGYFNGIMRRQAIERELIEATHA